MKRAAISPNAVARKLDSNLGSENQGKVLGVDSTGAVVPVEMSSGAKLYIVSGTITNTSGSYTTTINNEFITAEMKAVEMELGTPSIFGDKITVTCGAGFVTISCPSVSGTSTYKISLIKSIDDPTAVTSTEFDILSNRIGALSNLHTTDKTTIVAAVNENTDAIENIPVIKKDSFTGTTSASGNVSKTHSKKVIVLSAWVAIGDYIVTAFPGSGANDSGQYTWWFHIFLDTAAHTVYGSQSVTVYYTYIEV